MNWDSLSDRLKQAEASLGTLWVLPVVFVVFMLLGEIAARRLAALKERQLVEGGEA